MMRIGIVAPARRLSEDAAERVKALAASSSLPIDLIIHPQCYDSFGHFAGSDAARLEAFLTVANDPDIDAVWFARGGYGSARLLAGLQDQLNQHALTKVYLGYSDVGFLLAGLRRLGCQFCAHGPVVGDIVRQDGEAAIGRTLAFLSRQDAVGIEPHAVNEGPNLAYNLTTLCALLGTKWLDQTTSVKIDTILWLEDVGEYDYATDRRMFHLVNSAWFKNVSGVRIGRFSLVPENDVPFIQSSEEIIAHWCRQVGVPVLSLADIGHDSANKIVPFGNFSDWQRVGYMP